jgi:hypothetical protein
VKTGPVLWLTAFLFLGLVLFGGYIFFARQFCAAETPSTQILNWTVSPKLDANKEEKAAEGKNGGRKNKGKSAQPALPPSYSVVQESPANEKAGQIEPKGATWFSKFFCEAKISDLIIAFFSYVLCVATGWLVWATIKLWKAGESQLELLGSSTAAAHRAADAANLNAEALMNAEGAQIFPVIVEDNLREVLSGDSRYFIAAESPEILLLPPKLTYRLKNYGKTPAKLQSIMHNISFLELDSKSRLMHVADDFPLEIIGGAEVSSTLECVMLDHFKLPMAKAAKEYRAELIFYGEAVFTDFFDRQFRCIWECDCRSGEAKLVRHEQRLDPDKKE